MKAVILAGGFGTRISEETGSRPKVVRIIRLDETGQQHVPKCSEEEIILWKFVNVIDLAPPKLECEWRRLLEEFQCK